MRDETKREVVGASASRWFNASIGGTDGVLTDTTTTCPLAYLIQAQIPY